MFVRLIEARAAEGFEHEFERWAGPGGARALALATSPSFLGCELLRGVAGNGGYWLIERWASRAGQAESRAGLAAALAAAEQQAASWRGGERLVAEATSLGLPRLP